jgi:pimeloyl-ACP methyl ester carboxylesterase
MELVRQFMDALGIAQAPLVGHSMGGTTSLGTTLRYPDRITRVCVIGSPIVGSSLSPVLRFASVGWVGGIGRIIPSLWMPPVKLGIRIAAPVITKDRRWYAMVSRDMTRASLEAFFSSVGSLRRTDLRPRLSEIKIPVMGIYGKRDVIVHPRQHEPLKTGITQARIEVLPGSGHFPMLDEPDKYLALIRSFLAAAPDLDNHDQPLGGAASPERPAATVNAGPVVPSPQPTAKDGASP